MARSKFAKSVFKPKHPEKYVGKGAIVCRSSWETHFAHFCDTNPNILEWASEPLQIPYRNPVKNKTTIYVPDFLIRYRDKTGKIITELIEIKPHNQSVIKERMRSSARATVAVNHAKWAAAEAFCQKHQIGFRVLTENDLFRKT